VIVTPAPGEPGKMPFWHGDARPAARAGPRHRRVPPRARADAADAAGSASARTTRPRRAGGRNLVAYLGEQREVTGVAADDRTIVVERFRDELGDWRVCAADALRRPRPRAVGDGAARFREAAARALLLPKRRPGGRSPLWQQRMRAANLLAVAAKFGSFPMILEAYRECLRDVFDIPALVSTLARLERREVRVATVDSTMPSPFASALLFGYVANYIYDGDAPLAERRAQALAIDQTQLRELLGEAELRELLDADALEQVERELQFLEPARRAKSVDAVHDLLLRLGDLSAAEVGARASVDAGTALDALARARRAIIVHIGGDARAVPVEYAARYRDALGVPLPQGLPEALLEPAPEASQDLARRFARTHGPFTTAGFAARYHLGQATAETILRTLSSAGRLLEGEFRPGGSGREWCDPDVLQSVRRRSLAKLRREVVPVEPAALGRLITAWQGVVRPRAGLDALLDAVENLQGAPLPASIFESEILAGRLERYSPADLDALTAAGEVVWCGLGPLGDRDGRLALYLADHFPRLRRPQEAHDLAPREQAIVNHLQAAGASFFATLHEAAGGGYPRETVDALWNLVWKGLVTNDTFHALRAFTRPPERRPRKAAGSRSFRSRRVAPPSAEGRWSLVVDRTTVTASPTERATALAQQLLSRYGVITREVAAAEGIAGGFSAVYDILKALEDAGRVRRGYFVSGVAATQFALPAALELMRTLKDAPDEPEVVTLAATDPGNPYGTMLKWPVTADTTAGRGPTRSVGAVVLLVNGSLAAYISRGARQLTVFVPDDEPQLSTVARAIARRLARFGAEGGILIDEVNGVPAREHALAPFLTEAGFVASAMGYQIRKG
jgi:ATP-dependent helicase Lhr and Lhr-like helicase